ncbi:uncharacterized protein BDR25DRAFT_210137 [Lindgomyces ingoldianus]|uniref:Uncharacterized protein n=1 Tax=Lindgomyces ingoldianus TaxID=673940 RepID=A0ACB6RCZ9_9PLEO|nr:uncharacterized protein BDR25DRAFT_210137 [Lindgomyces ingoldianus]KAF2476605.1 hypothetical protein BDR25DRAFT_210137 [Lindgomyces ingoldianus]
METTTLSCPLLPLARPSVRRVALACIQCRSRKVKCDATTPFCKRCQVDGKLCGYLKSRRGGRPRRSKPQWDQLSILVNEAPSSGTSTQRDDVLSATSHNISTFGGLSTDSSSQTCSDAGSRLDAFALDGSRNTIDQSDELLTQYYTFFHTAHPCVLPRWSLQIRRSSNPSSLDPLLPVLLYIGSIFTPSIPSTPLEITALQSLDSARARGTPSPFFIQALVLYSIAVYWCDQTERALVLLDEAIQGAFELGMHKAEFGLQYGEGNPILEESWRRTWWMIYVTEAHVSGSTHTFPTKTGQVQTNTELPCEEYQYESGSIPNPLKLESYNVREFSDAEFSSFAHLVGLTQGLNRILSTRRRHDSEHAKLLCANVDTCVTAWCSLLHKSKRKLLKDDGSVDELLFKANTLIFTYIVDLHRELSTLKYSPIEAVSKCAPPAPPENSHTIKEDTQMHTSKVLFAIEKLNGLLTLPTRLATHTPFIICMIANMTIAHLSACRYVFQEPKLSLEREKIRLNMGVLKMLGEYWPLGERTYGELGIIAREILSLGDEEVHVSQKTPPLADFLDIDFDVDCAFDMSDLSSNSMGGGPVEIAMGSDACGAVGWEVNR